MLVFGLPSTDVVVQRLSTFLVNILTIFGVSVLVYYLLEYRKETLERFTSHTLPPRDKKKKKSSK